MCIQNPSKHLRWSFMEKKVNNSNDTFCHFELQTGAHLEPSGTSAMEFFAKIVNN